VRGVRYELAVPLHSAGACLRTARPPRSCFVAARHACMRLRLETWASGSTLRCEELQGHGAQVAAAIQGSNLAGGFVLPNLVRFLGGEAAYLSTTRGGPTMFLNLEDDLAGSTGAANARFQARGPIAATLPPGPGSRAGLV